MNMHKNLSVACGRVSLASAVVGKENER
jgi:hypothetical protein